MGFRAFGKQAKTSQEAPAAVEGTWRVQAQRRNTLGLHQGLFDCARCCSCMCLLHDLIQKVHRIACLPNPHKLSNYLNGQVARLA